MFILAEAAEGNVWRLSKLVRIKSPHLWQRSSKWGTYYLLIRALGSLGQTEFAVQLRLRIVADPHVELLGLNDPLLLGRTPELQFVRAQA